MPALPPADSHVEIAEGGKRFQFFAEVKAIDRAVALAAVKNRLVPDLLAAPYREIAEAAGIGLGTVGWAFFDLERRGYLAAAAQRRNRRLLEPTRLPEEWVTNFPIRLRPKLNPRRFRAPDPGWWQQARLPDGARWDGEVAAAKLTDHLKPAAATIYLEPGNAREALATLVQEHRLRADPQGNVETLDAFWTLPELPEEGTPRDLVPPLLVYADLMATLDPRNLEIAKRIREQYIEHALRRA